MGERRKKGVLRRGERRLEWKHVRVEGAEGGGEAVFSSEAIYFYYLA